MKQLLALLALCLALTACEKKLTDDEVSNYKKVVVKVYNYVAPPTTDTAQLTIQLQVYAQPNDSLYARSRLLLDSTLTQRRRTTYGTEDSPFEFTRQFDNVYDSREQIWAIATVRRLATPNQPEISQARTIRNFAAVTLRVPL